MIVGKNNAGKSNVIDALRTVLEPEVGPRAHCWLREDPTSQLELWEAAVSGSEIQSEKEEERRVLFVALTRAARYCLVALPDDQRGRAVADACAVLGFTVVST